MIADGWAGSSEWGFDRIGGHRVRIGSHSGGRSGGQTARRSRRSLHPTSVSHLRRAQSSAKLLTLRKVCHIAGMLTVKKRPRTAYSGRPPAFPGNKRQSER